MSRSRNSRLNSRLWVSAGIGAVIGGIAGFLMGALLTIPFAIFGFALGMGIGWLLHAEDSATDEKPGPSDNG